MFFLALLAAAAVAAPADAVETRQLKYSGARDDRARCTADGKWEWFYEHKTRCADLGPVVCSGVRPSSDHAYRWSCAVGEVEDYIVTTTVNSDDTLAVTLVPRSNVHPLIYVVIHFLGVFTLCYCLRKAAPPWETD